MLYSRAVLSCRTEQSKLVDKVMDEEFMVVKVMDEVFMVEAMVIDEVFMANLSSQGQGS